MRLRSGGAALLLALVLPIAGCAIAPAPATSASDRAWAQRRDEMSRLEHWLLQARIASGRIGWSGNLHWRQDAGRFDIRVSGPLGSGVVQARGHLGEVEIRTARETVVTREPEILLQQSLGWSLPLERLRYWALGVPYPDTPSTLIYDSVGRLQVLEQDGWRLEYAEYGFYQHYELPRRFTLDNGDNHFRVVVDDWSEIG
jgi:outer membrane lipoprotein LolB